MDGMIAPGLLLVSMLIAAAAGVIRGITGFGGALFMMPPLTLILGPRVAVLTVVLLEGFAAGPMLRAAMRQARYRVIVPIALAACLTVPIGGHFLLTLDPEMTRRLIAGVVLIFSLALLKELQFQGPHRLPVSIALGAFSGVLLGATSIGAPPVILYLLSGPDPVAVTRANLTLYIVAMSIVMLVVLTLQGVFEARDALIPLILGPCFYAGVKLGDALFPRFSDKTFRRFALALLCAVSAVVLIV